MNSSNVKQSIGNITVNTVPIPKLTALLNDFITKNVNHLNK